MNLGHYFFIGLFFCSSTLFGQEEQPAAPPIVLKKPTIQPVEEQDDIWSLEFGALTWKNDGQSFNPNRFSFELGLNYHFELNIGQKHAIAFGVGYRFLRLNHSGTFLNQEQLGTYYLPASTTDELDYSRLHLNQLHLPVEFRFKLNNNLKLYMGYEGYFMLKAINRSNINEQEKSFRDFKSLNNFQHGPKLRIGMHDFFIFMRYNTSGVFSNGVGSTNYFSVGVSLGG